MHKSVPTGEIRVLSVTTTPSAWCKTSILPGSLNWTALGLHPQLAHERKGELELFEALVTRTQYVGEIGLDGGHEFTAFREDQVAVFEHILQTCSAVGGRIMSIHSRRAAEAVLDLIESHPNAGTSILHWFSGNAYEVRRAFELNCWFSVGPAMLKSERGRNIVASLPREIVLTESDGPFAMIDGRPISPWDVSMAVQDLSRIWRTGIDETHQILGENLRRLNGGF